ncbi:MAG: hypothetical protein GX491_04680 [Chloroflexi bacterium]|nr:hypothetical protein [Chloroflexota bacterium]
MLDDLRNNSVFLDDDESQDLFEEGETFQEQPPAAQARVAPQQETLFLGMTAVQRFILSLVLFFMVCLLGAFALVLSGSVAPPF